MEKRYFVYLLLSKGASAYLPVSNFLSGSLRLSK